MPRTDTHTHTFRHDWDRVVCAYWQRFDAPYPEVKRIDILSRQIDKETGNLHLVRLLTLSDEVSSSMSFFWKKKTPLFAIESSVVDRKGKTLTSETHNVTHSNIKIRETAQLTQGANQQHTQLVQKIEIDTGMSFTENIGLGKLRSAASKCLKTMETALSGGAGALTLESVISRHLYFAL